MLSAVRSRESAPEQKRRGQVSCGHAMSFEEWAAAGLDAGTTVKDSAALCGVFSGAQGNTPTRVNITIDGMSMRARRAFEQTGATPSASLRRSASEGYVRPAGLLAPYAPLQADLVA